MARKGESGKRKPARKKVGTRRSKKVDAAQGRKAADDQVDVPAVPDASTGEYSETYYGEETTPAEALPVESASAIDPAQSGSQADEIEALLAAQAHDEEDAAAGAGTGAVSGSGKSRGRDSGGGVSFATIMRRILRFRTPIFIILLLLIAGGTFLPYLLEESEADVDASMLVPSVKAVGVTKGDLQHTIQAPGTVTFLEKAAVTSKVLGRVENLLVDQGEYVKRGQPLAQIETFELELQLKQARAGVNRAQAQLELSQARYQNARRDADRQIKDLERIQSDIIEAKAGYLNSRRNMKNQQEIYEMGGISREELKTVYAEYISSMSRYYQTRKNYQIRIVGFRDEDLQEADMAAESGGPAKREQFIDFNTQVELGDVRVAEAAVRNARLELESIDLLIRESTIRSPLDGVIASRTIEVGESAKEGEPLFTVIRMDRVLISTSIPEEEVQFVEPEQQVSYTVDALSDFQDTPRAATVYQISPVIDVSTRTAELRVMAENPELDLSPGMFVRCAVATRAKKDAIAVPESALIDRRTENEVDDVADVFVLQDGLALRRKVILGERYGDRMEVRAGLEVGEEIAIENVQNLKDGGSVRVQSAGPSPLDADASPAPNTNTEPASSTNTQTNQEPQEQSR
ncbi:MAG: efflux RND transporter periplasmic adaptor subunit [bacterium]|nr:efflux RND transporter periplasmic adaptor subunit [bacterium]